MGECTWERVRRGGRTGTVSDLGENRRIVIEGEIKGSVIEGEIEGLVIEGERRGRVRSGGHSGVKWGGTGGIKAIEAEVKFF